MTSIVQIGMDVHKNSFTVCCYDIESEKTKHLTVDVYEKPTKYSRTEGNPVMIYYKYQMTTGEQWQILTGEGLPKTDTTKAEIDKNTPISA